MKIMIRAHDLGVTGEENIVKRLAELGLDGVQFVAYKSIDGVGYKVGGLDPERAEKIGKTFADAGVEVALVGAYFNPVHPNKEKVELGEGVFADYLSLASRLGASVVGSETGSYMGEPWTYHPDNRKPEARAAVADIFRRLADVAKKHGACVGIEGAYGHVCYTPDVLADLIKAIDRDNIRVIFDLFNYLSDSNYESAYDLLGRAHELFGKQILLYHVKDFTVTDGAVRQCGVGRGVLNYRRILKEIYAVNPDATLVLEDTTGENIPFAVNYLKEILAEIEK